MRSNEIFARMTPEQATAFLSDLRGDAPDVARMAVAAAASAFKLRPQFMRKQPRARQAEWMRKALARGTMASVAEEILAEYFLGAQKDLLVEWLDTIGLEHEDGQLANDTPECPSAVELEKAVAEFRAGDGEGPRELLLRAFAGQSAIDWPELDRAVSDPGTGVGAGTDSGAGGGD